jgi:hypothetical protein
MCPRELPDSRFPLAVAEQDHQWPPTPRRDFFRAEMLFGGITPAHSEKSSWKKDGGRRVLFP